MKATHQDPLIKTIEPLIAAIGGTIIDADSAKPSDVTLEVDGFILQQCDCLHYTVHSTG